MQAKNIVSLLFDPKPSQWGLRGDPYFWDELALTFEKEGVPNLIDDFFMRLHELYKDLSGEELNGSEIIFIKRYPQRGMSGGLISSSFWKKNGFPLLLDRHSKIFKSSTSPTCE